MATEANEAPNVMENLIDHVGFSRWTVLHICVGLAVHSILAMHSMSGAFIAPVQNYTCRLPNTTTTTTTTNTTTITTSSLTYPDPQNVSTLSEIYSYHRIPGDECSYLVNGSKGQEYRPCTEWNFDHSSFTSTITSEFSLVCGRAFLVPVYQSLYMVGCGLGSVLGGILSDKFGRRSVISVGIVLFLVLAAAPAWLPNLFLIYTARLLLGFCHMVTLQAAYVLVMEVVPSWTRAVLGMLVALPWALFIILFGGIGYLFREWRELQAVISLPFLVTLPLFVFMNESPRWLMVQRQEEKVMKVLQRAANMSRVVLPPAQIEKLKEEMKSKEVEEEKTADQSSVWQQLSNKVLKLVVLFRTPRLRLRTLVMCLNFFTASGVYFSLSLGATAFSADPYMYMALSGVVEIPSYTLMGPLVACAGRKWPAVGSFLFTGATLCILPFIPNELWQVDMALALLSKVTISGVFVELYLYSSEVFPTEVRIQALGTALLASRLGSILSPFFNDILVPVFPLAMPVVVGGLSILASLSTCLLPETKGKNLPSLIEEIESST